MKAQCVKCRKNTENLNLKIVKTKNGRLIMQSKCIKCGFKNSRSVKKMRSTRITKQLRSQNNVK